MNDTLTIGLETHLELSTASKLFCGCSTAFGGAPNSRCCPVCLGLPGALPVLNREAVRLAIRAGAALGSEICADSRFDRKHYHYPDLPKGYQITQQFHPICRGGRITLADGSVIRIRRIHLEEDAGKLVDEAGRLLADYNRAGIPLIEIVTEPDFHSAEQVRGYLEQLSRMMQYLNVSDCKMQEGSMRSDLNVSIGDRKTEIKNIGSPSFAAKAIRAEERRQRALLEQGRQIVSQTVRYNEQTGETVPLRRKEEGEDYRYFPDPNLPPLMLDPGWIEAIKSSLPELPDQKERRYRTKWGISEEDARHLTRFGSVAQYFEQAAERSGQPKLCATLILQHLFRLTETEEQKRTGQFVITAEQTAAIAERLADGTLPKSALKEVFAALYAHRPFDEVLSPDRFRKTDRETLLAAAKAAIAENPKAVADLQSGKGGAIGALIGAVMRATGGQAEPKEVKDILTELLH